MCNAGSKREGKSRVRLTTSARRRRGRCWSMRRRMLMSMIRLSSSWSSTGIRCFALLHPLGASDKGRCEFYRQRKRRAKDSGASLASYCAIESVAYVAAYVSTISIENLQLTLRVSIPIPIPTDIKNPTLFWDLDFYNRRRAQSFPPETTNPGLFF